MMRKMCVYAFLLAIFLSVLMSGQEVYSFGGCEADCAKCHSLDKDEARQILMKLKAVDARVVDIKMSPIGGLWEVSVEDKGKKGTIYVAFSKKYVMGGAIYEIDSNKAQEISGESNRRPERYVDTSKIPLDSAILLGDNNAKYKVVVFTDPDCPFCSKLHEEIKKVVSERKDIAFYIKLMPLKMHPDAYWKSQSIQCGKSLRLLDDNFQKKAIPKPDCDTKIIDENISLAGDLGITGTPTLVLPDGLVVIGAKDARTITEQVLNPKRSGTEK